MNGMNEMAVGDLVAYGPMLLALPIAALAGLISFASPCSLPLLPGYLAYVSGAAGSDASRQVTDARRSHSVIGTSLFVLGFAVVFVSYGALFGALGTLLIRHQDVILRVLGVFTILFGLVFAGAFSRVPALSATFRPGYQPKVGLVGAPMLGVMFGIGWTPCIGPTLAAVLSLSTTTGTAGRGAALALAYSLGLGIPFLAAAFGIGRAFRAFAFARRHAVAITRLGGGFLIVLGILEVTGVWSWILSHLRVLIGTWQVPL